MAGGHPWTEEEASFCARLWALGHTNGEVWKEHSESGRFPARSVASIAKAKTSYPIVRDAVKEAEKRGEAYALPGEPDEQIHDEESGDERQVFVYGSKIIKTEEELLKAAKVDFTKWEAHGGKVAAWPVAMKINDEPVMVQLHYVSVNLRRKPKPHEIIRAVQIHVTPKKYTAAKSGFFTSVHWGDIHFPYHDPRAIDILYQVLDIVQPGVVADHGDTLDCNEISKYPKDPWNRTPLGDEIKMGGRFLGEVHALTPDAEHIWFEGNHEERLKRVVWAAAESRAMGEVLTLPGMRERLEWGSLLGIDTLGWEVVPYPKHKLLWDKLVLIHGNKVRADSSLSARAEYQTYGKSGLSGHTHRRGSFHHRDHNGTNTWYELGMLGAVRDDYVAHANWQQGLMVVSWSEDKQEWGPEPIPIHDGVAYFRGLRLEGKD